MSVIGLVSNQGTPNDTRVGQISLAIDALLSMTNAIYGPVYRKIPSKHNGKVESVKDKM